MIAAQFLESFLASFSFDDGVAMGRKGGAHDAADLRLIVHDQHGSGNHAVPARV